MSVRRRRRRLSFSEFFAEGLVRSPAAPAVFPTSVKAGLSARPPTASVVVSVDRSQSAARRGTYTRGMVNSCV